MSTPPHADHAERAVLGALLYGAPVADDLADVLQSRDFYSVQHGLIYDACMAVARTAPRVDVPLVIAELGADLQRVGGPIYLSDLVGGEFSPGNAVKHARTVVDKALARRLIEAGQRIVLQASEDHDVQRAAEDARKVVEDAATHATTEAHGVTAANLLEQTLDALEGDAPSGMDTGWPDLDELTGGIRPGQLIIVGARPGVGKSVLAGNLAAHLAGQGLPVHVASLEMPRTELMGRMLSAACRVELSRVLNHRLSESDWSSIAKRAGVITDWPLWVDDTPSQSLLQIRARARTTRKRHGSLGAIVVDYLQLMAPRDRRVPREQQVGELSEGLKALAKELEVPVIALAQVNRGSTDRTDPRPRLSDLRESGRIEADADQVWLLHRQDLVDPESCSGELDVIVAKNRNGPIGQVSLAFQGHYSRAVSLAV